MTEFIPKLVCFSCKFGWGYLNSNGYDKQIKNLIPVICSGKLDATHVVGAFDEGADGVLILGCPDGQCHFKTGNYQARKRVLLLHNILKEFGVEPRRLKIALDIDPEGSRIPIIIEEMKTEVGGLGPLSQKVYSDIGHVDASASEGKTSEKRHSMGLRSRLEKMIWPTNPK